MIKIIWKKNNNRLCDTVGWSSRRSGRFPTCDDEWRRGCNTKQINSSKCAAKKWWLLEGGIMNAITRQKCLYFKCAIIRDVNRNQIILLIWIYSQYQCNKTPDEFSPLSIFRTCGSIWVVEDYAHLWYALNIWFIRVIWFFPKFYGWFGTAHADESPINILWLRN